LEGGVKAHQINEACKNTPTNMRCVFEHINDKYMQSAAKKVLQEKEATGVTKLSVHSLPCRSFLVCINFVHDAEQMEIEV